MRLLPICIDQIMTNTSQFRLPIITSLLTITLGHLVSTTAYSSTLLLHRDFAEVHNIVQPTGNTYSWTPQHSLAPTLVPGSIELMQAGVLSMRRLAPTENLLAAFEGRQVRVYEQLSQTFVLAKVLRADIGLFEIGGQFRQIESPNVQFPDLQGMRFTPEYFWQLTDTKSAATLRYITRGLRWENTRYTLDVIGEKTATLQAWVEVNNQLQTDFSAPDLTLFAGAIALPESASSSTGTSGNLSVRDQLLSARNVVNIDSSAESTFAGQSAASERAGVQHYQYPHKVRFAGNSTTALPFIKTQVTIKSLLDYEGTFNTDARAITALQRVIAFTAKQGLPAGEVTVRADSQLTGHTTMQSAPQQGNVRLLLGRDLDTQITRSVEVLQNTDAIRRYRVSFEVKNVKPGPITVRIAEFLPGDEKIESIKLPDFTLQTGGVVSRPVIAAGATFIGSYEIEFVDEDA
jgi:hypothetical protein